MKWEYYDVFNLVLTFDAGSPQYAISLDAAPGLEAFASLLMRAT